MVGGWRGTERKPDCGVQLAFHDAVLTAGSLDRQASLLASTSADGDSRCTGWMKLERASYLLDDGKNPGLCVVVSVSTDTLERLKSARRFAPRAAEQRVTHQIDLVGALVGAVGPHEPEEGILGGLRDGLGREAGDCCGRHVVCDALEADEGGGWLRGGGGDGREGGTPLCFGRHFYLVI